MITTTVEAGLLLRRHMRVNLDVLGISWKEYKGFLGSTFVITGNRQQITALNAWIDEVKKEVLDKED